MKTEKKWYFIIILIITTLTYNQKWGLNALIICITSLAYFYIFGQNTKSKKWWLSALFWLGSGLSIFFSSSFIGIVLFFIASFNFAAINFNSKYSFPYTLLHTFFSFIQGIAIFVTPNNESKDSITAKTKSDNIVVKKIFLIGIPVILVVVFLKIYQLANPKFAELTTFISLEFVNWNFIATYGILMVLLYGFYLFNQYEISEKRDLNTPNTIDKGFTDTIQQKIGLNVEKQMATITLVVLNLLLFSFLITDGFTLFNSDINNELTHSQNVHLGINILIISIVLVIFIVGFIFRGGLNFSTNKTIKIFATVWLLQNIIITFFNSIKNFNYINEWGLTYKRIGVYTYLILCIIGLIFTIYKIWKNKSFTFLVRRVTFSFVGFLIVFSLINWKKIIINYNLNDKHFTEQKIDFYYNLSLGYEVYPNLINYFKTHPNSNHNIQNVLDYNICKHINFNPNNWQSYPSLNWRIFIAEKELKNYVPFKNNPYKKKRIW